jgi:hypothetical protein
MEGKHFFNRRNFLKTSAVAAGSLAGLVAMPPSCSWSGNSSASLHRVRQKTLTEFRKRDDQWLAQVDPSFFDNQPTNNYCKWFHVCEHASNHNGQIKWLINRLPF